MISFIHIFRRQPTAVSPYASPPLSSVLAHAMEHGEGGIRPRDAELRPASTDLQQRHGRLACVWLALCE